MKKLFIMIFSTSFLGVSTPKKEKSCKSFEVKNFKKIERELNCYKVKL